MELFTAAQMREIDRVAIQERGIPSTLLMERAAQGIVRETLALAGPGSHAAIVFCGPGNNGGDGVAAARFLLREGWRVKCVLVGKREKMTDDNREMERRLIESGGILEDFDQENVGKYLGFDVAVDALFGIGLNSGLRPDAAKAVGWMSRAQWVVSADIPSGVHADTGKVLGDAVRADVTVTFSAGKPGLYVGEGAVHAGRVVIHDIGIPEDLLAQGCGVAVTQPPVLPHRKRDAHKGDFGRLFILAGSEGYTGAPVLASRAAVCAGAGLVTLAVPREIYPIVAVKCDEAMPWPLPDDDTAIVNKASACDLALIGPGLGQGERAQALVLRLLRELTCPVILDADGLNILSRHIDVLDQRQAVTILTPHDGEFARLSGCPLPIVERLTAARDFGEKHRCVLVLKGHRTITAAGDGRCFVNTTGNPGMARGGSGDALAGLMAGLLVQTPDDLDAVLRAVWLHGRAGDLAAAEKGEYGMTVGDLIEQIPYAMKECEEA
jgi:NAD(P)H-hydrate epimerase